MTTDPSAALDRHSPYLAELARRETVTFRAVRDRGPGPVIAALLAEVAALPPTLPRPALAAALRQAKRRLALAVAMADLGGIWRLEQVTAALSDFAQAALTVAVAHLLRGLHDAGRIRLADPAHPAPDSGLIVLGMGKLGARELNYSSDIDLILIHDPDAPLYAPAADGEAAAEPGPLMSQLARALVGLMEARDAEGYVFRTDLRLRPDPAATPPSISLPAAVAYYETMGQNWERAAMIKARPVAGDLAAGAAFLEAIRPFVWRRGLDFALIADIHAVKRRIDQHRAGPVPAGDAIGRIAGRNIKLGPGGIREIEFLAQTLALIWGGRDPALRVPGTVPALRALARAGLIPGRVAGTLVRAYRFLRRVEHRLQMVADRQTHSLPGAADALADFARFMGYPGATALAPALLRHLDRVRACYAEVFEQIPDPLGAASAVGEIDLSGDDPAPAETVARLGALGFADPPRVIATLRGWLAGRVRALRSERAREILARLLSAILAEFARQPTPDAAFARLDALLARLPAGVGLLSLFERNPALIERLAAILGAAPSLGEYLAQNAGALDALLAGDTPDPGRSLRARLADARDLETTIATVRAVVREVEFAVAAATLEGRLDVDAAAARRAALADAALAALLDAVMDDFASRYGRVRGGAMAVVLLGKAGGREMMAGSDLDLMLIYDHPARVAQSSGGPRTLPVAQYFIRAAHAFVAAVTAPGADGPLYEVDMRLRPSGNKGPVAVSLAGFRRYHQQDAWTWERMALTRARVVAGPARLSAHVRAAVAEALLQAGDPARVRADAAAMRARLARELPPAGPWDVKLRAGGGMEVAFIAEVLQLTAARPDCLEPGTGPALRALAAAGVLAGEDAARLIAADRLWRTVQGMLRITLGRAPPATLPEASVRTLLRAVGQARGETPPLDLAGLLAILDREAAATRALFVKLVGELPP
ncbi:MAG: bifunctional [glutamine synthetase] adenylyltransferase/[glutamine synthetase]-adenylyl-L-tyrosine phosphorylase [Acetobacteraceae bacterium]